MTTPTSFGALALSAPVLQALEKVGYEKPSPIQEKTIPLLLAGRDVIGQAQTGTGKTAAFALPILSQIDLKQSLPQALVLAPTRELAIQVAEAFQTYAAFIPGFHVLPIYGGSDFRGQLQGLRRGCHVVVGTPGRVMDHMRRGTLDLSGLKTIVLDEADEMLRMGFIDDVEWVLEQAPKPRQITLFSATMPPPIRKIATQHLHEPAHVTIEVKTVSADTIRQRYWPVRGTNKLDALTRILEAEPFNGMIIFVRTKTLTADLSDKLAARGFASSPLNGDMSQQLREATIDKLRKGRLDILIATDVAARGLDVERISHVVNYDIPYDVETYIHRIGRTGRAGREGDAILFVAPREQRLLGAIERATRKKIELMELPSTELINDRRTARFMQDITDTLAEGELESYLNLVRRYEQEHNVPAEEIAAALAKRLRGDHPLLLAHTRETKAEKDEHSDKPRRKREAAPREDHRAREHDDDNAFDTSGGTWRDKPRAPRREFAAKDPTDAGPLEPGMERFRLEVGHAHDVKPSNIVGAIANEAGIESKHIGRIQIYDEFSFIDLPEGMPKETFQHLQRVWVQKRQLRITRVTDARSKKAEKREPSFKRERHEEGEKPHKRAKLATTDKPETSAKREKKRPPFKQ
ncbi:MAG: DEAD/DEAH box helicase [Pseudomonadales bacterium]|jgi:ATP-dependent RNA helicase DeaD|nr:DEAD/DEAH box helicase [Pseudomonadales bacterium]